MAYVYVTTTPQRVPAHELTYCAVDVTVAVAEENTGAVLVLTFPPVDPHTVLPVDADTQEG